MISVIQAIWLVSDIFTALGGEYKAELTWDQALFSFRFWKLHSGGQDETKRNNFSGSR